MSNCLLIILGIGSCVTLGGFPSKFLKYCFQRCIRSCWLVAFSSAFAVLFLLHTSFTVCHAILDCLSSTESLILSVWFVCILFVLSANSFCLFFQLIHFVPFVLSANSFCAFLSFGALVLVRFLLHLEAVFSSAHFSLTANVSHGILWLVLCLVGMHSAATSQWSLKKFSYSSFRVCVSIFSCSASNLFLSANGYLSLIFMLLSRDQS